MENQELLKRIVCDPRIMVGKPTIKGSRLTVAYILQLLAHGVPKEKILADYPHISEQDIQACMLFASRAMDDISFMPVDQETA